MPSLLYERKKDSIYRWRLNHPEDWARTHNRQSAAYYTRNKEKITIKNRLKAAYQKEAEMFRNILIDQ